VTPPWTYSRLTAFETCPKQFYHLKVLRDFKDPPNAASEWGGRVHSAFENFIDYAVPLPTGMQQWAPILDKFLALKGKHLVEYKYAIDSAFKPTEWDGAWSRGIADFLVRGKCTSVQVDWKTGKMKPSEQLALYAAYEFHENPEVETVHTAFVWLKLKKITKETYTREQLSGIWDNLLPRVRKLESAYERDSWPARPSGLCREWCSVTTCNHNGRKPR